MHEAAPTQDAHKSDQEVPASTIQNTSDGSSVPSQNTRKYTPRPVNSSRIVSRPVPNAQIEDPREFQLGQIRRRFKPTEEADGTTFKLDLTPSDPDFPFEMEKVRLRLFVPSLYPTAGKPSIRVLNEELKRGFQLNVEKGFADIAAESPNATLLGLLNRLDKDLELLLSKEMAETVKFIRPSKPLAPESTQITTNTPLPPIPTPVIQAETPKIHTAEQKNQAQTKRQTDVRQVVARLGRLEDFRQFSDGVTFAIPFTPAKKNVLPTSLRTQKSFQLLVPELYNLQPPRIEFNNNGSEEARAIERCFEKRVTAFPDTSLLAHINYLSLNAHTMSALPTSVESVQPQLASLAVTEPGGVPKESASLIQITSRDVSKPHIQTVPRPPEWSTADEDLEEWSSDETNESNDEFEPEADSMDDEEQEEKPAATTSASAERGILLSFPNLELHSIELLELVSLNITVKCDRCKDTMDVPRLKDNTAGDHKGMKEEMCKKCAASLAIGSHRRPKLPDAKLTLSRISDGLDTCQLFTSRLSGYGWLYCC